MRTDYLRYGLLVLGTILGMLSIPSKTVAQLGAVGGVYIDPQGVLRETSVLSQDDRLKLLHTDAQLRPLQNDVLQPAKLRKISLKKLEAVLREAHAQQKPLPPEVEYLAGLQQVQYIFFSPETKDVILAGPASGWKQAASGEIVSTQTNRPVLHLDDLIVALRHAYAPQKTWPMLGCSIEPTLSGMQNYARYLQQMGGRMDRSRAGQIIGGMAQAMGMQSIKVYGVPADSRFATKMVAADYRLKRLALAHDPIPVKGVMSFLDLNAKRFRGGAQKQHRWWFLAGYDAIEHTPDKLSYEFQGQAMKVTTARQVPGFQNSEAKPSATAEQFSTQFTAALPKLSQMIPVFAELENLIGLSVATEIMAQHKGDEFWRPVHLLDEKNCPVDKNAIPAQVPSLASFRLVKNRHWMITISGGVEIRPQVIAKSAKETTDSSLPTIRRESRIPLDNEQPADWQWWWD